jgi:phosphonoacetaldehyde hydrolase
MKTSTKPTSKVIKMPNPTIFPYHDTPKVRACVLDFSGTLVDAHVIAPAVAFVYAFEKDGFKISMPEARKPMGLRKDFHIAKILEIPEVRRRWVQQKGKEPTQADVDRIFQYFIPLQLEVLKTHAGLIPGALETMENVRKQYGVKLGATTGFTRQMVDMILAEMKKEGARLDCAVAGDDIENNMGFRPAPFMVMRNLERLGVYDRRTVIKVDDTLGGVGEGLNAGVWTVGIYRYSNYTDIDSLEQWKNMKSEDFEKKVEISKNILLKSGAHYIADSITDLPEIIEDVNKRIAKGESP